MHTLAEEQRTNLCGKHEEEELARVHIVRSYGDGHFVLVVDLVHMRVNAWSMQEPVEGVEA